MPVERTLISLSQLGELLGVDPARLIAVEMNRKAKTAQRRQERTTKEVLLFGFSMIPTANHRSTIQH